MLKYGIVNSRNVYKYLKLDNSNNITIETSYNSHNASNKKGIIKFYIKQLSNKQWTLQNIDNNKYLIVNKKIGQQFVLNDYFNSMEGYFDIIPIHKTNNSNINNTEFNIYNEDMSENKMIDKDNNTMPADKLITELDNESKKYTNKEYTNKEEYLRVLRKRYIILQYTIEYIKLKYLNYLL